MNRSHNQGNLAVKHIEILHNVVVYKFTHCHVARAAGAVLAGQPCCQGGWDDVGHVAMLPGRLGWCWLGDHVTREAGVVLAG